jgi:acyl carrier protein
MQRDAVNQAVREIASSVLDRAVDPDEDIVRGTEPRWDSLKHIELLFAVEERFGIQFSQQELADLDRLGAVVDRVMVYVEA